MRKVYGYVSEQGTAMAETAYCENDLKCAEESLAIAKTETDADQSFNLHEVSGNEAMYCMDCGYNSYGDNVSEEDW